MAFSPGKTKRQRVLEKTQGHCAYCGVGLVSTYTKQPNMYCIDHVMAIYHGGTHHLDNLLPCCHRCNCQKRTKSLEEYRFWLSRQGLPHFTPAHTQYLKDLGIPLPDDFPCYPVITFWFEDKGIVR